MKLDLNKEHIGVVTHAPLSAIHLKNMYKMHITIGKRALIEVFSPVYVRNREEYRQKINSEVVGLQGLIVKAQISAKNYKIERKNIEVFYENDKNKES